MEELDDVMQKLCELKGSMLAMRCLVTAMATSLPAAHRRIASEVLQDELEACRTFLLNARISEHTLRHFEQDALDASAILRGDPRQ